MEEILPGLKVIIASPEGNVEMIYPVESFTGSEEAPAEKEVIYENN